MCLQYTPTVQRKIQQRLLEAKIDCSEAGEPMYQRELAHNCGLAIPLFLKAVALVIESSRINQ